MATTKTTNISTEDKPTKKFNKTTLVPCKSICNGVLYVFGDQSKSDYMFWDFGDIQDIQYQDLTTMITRHSRCIYKPQFIVMDEDFIAQNPAIKSVYESMYTKSDLREILHLPLNDMKETILKLPDGAKEAILGLASSMIETGELDSIQKVKALDEIFDTKLIFATNN